MLPSPRILSVPGTPLRFEGANPCPTVGAQTYFSTNRGPRNSTCHCETREGHPETKDLISALLNHPFLSSLSAYLGKGAVTQRILQGAARTAVVV